MVPKPSVNGHNNVTYTVVDQVFDLKIHVNLTVSVRGTIQDAFKQLAIHDPAQAAAIKESINNGTVTGSKKTSTSLLTSRAQDDDCCTPEQFFCDISYDADCIDIA